MWFEAFLRGLTYPGSVDVGQRASARFCDGQTFLSGLYHAARALMSRAE